MTLLPLPGAGTLTFSRSRASLQGAELTPVERAPEVSFFLWVKAMSRRGWPPHSRVNWDEPYMTPGADASSSPKD